MDKGTFVTQDLVRSTATWIPKHLLICLTPFRSQEKSLLHILCPISSKQKASLSKHGGNLWVIPTAGLRNEQCFGEQKRWGPRSLSVRVKTDQLVKYPLIQQGRHRFLHSFFYNKLIICFLTLCVLDFLFWSPNYESIHRSCSVSWWETLSSINNITSNCCKIWIPYNLATGRPELKSFTFILNEI